MKNFKKSAQSLIEYGLILALVAIIAITVLSKFGTSITNVGNNTSNTIDKTSDNAMDNYCKSSGLGTYDKTAGKCTDAPKTP